MTLGTGPLTGLHPDYSSPEATATPWADAEAALRRAEIFWLSTVRPGGRPHVTPLLAVLDEGVATGGPALYFCTGADERKAHNLAGDPHCALTTGRNDLSGGLDVVAEGTAQRVEDDQELRRLAALWEDKYGAFWHFDVEDGAFFGTGAQRAEVFEVLLSRVFAFAKGEVYAQTRYRFGQPSGTLAR